MSSSLCESVSVCLVRLPTLRKNQLRTRRKRCRRRATHAGRAYAKSNPDSHFRWALLGSPFGFVSPHVASLSALSVSGPGELSPSCMGKSLTALSLQRVWVSSSSSGTFKPIDCAGAMFAPERSRPSLDSCWLLPGGTLKGKLVLLNGMPPAAPCYTGRHDCMARACSRHACGQNRRLRSIYVGKRLHWIASACRLQAMRGQR